MTKRILIKDQRRKIAIQARNVSVAGVEITGILYQQPPNTQITSYQTYDEGWHYANGEFDKTRPANPLYVAELDTEALDPYRTLKQNNAFGNLNRFTDDEGGQTYTNKYIIDHLTGLAYAYLGYGYNKDDAFAAAAAATNFGYSDWRLMTWSEVAYVFNWELRIQDCAPWTELSLTTNGAFWLCTQQTPYNSANGWAIFINNNSIASRGKTLTTNGVILTRTHFS